MTNNNVDYKLLANVLAGTISLKTFKKNVGLMDVTTIHNESGLCIADYIAASSRFEFATDAIEFLISKKGFDVNHQNEEGESILFSAIEVSNMELVDLCLQYKANPNLKNKKGETPLFRIIDCFDNAIAEALLRFGADVTIRDDSNSTVIELCEEISGDGELQDLIELLSQYEVENSSQKLVSIYDENTLSKVLKNIPSEDSPAIPLLNRMLTKGGMRTLKEVDEEMFYKVEDLKVRFPHFSEVITYVCEQLSLSLLTKEPYFRINPVLFYGDPGLGKTKFNRELSKIIGNEFEIIDGGNVSGGFAIGGGNPIWKDSSPGKVAKCLIAGSCANPIIQIDEIDKMSAQPGFDPFGPLYPLLEHETSVDFTDEFVDVPLDCSYVNWIATANDLNKIPTTILSRFTVFKIPSPTKEQMQNIVRSVYLDIINNPKHEWSSKFIDVLGDDLIMKLSSMTPRQIYKLVISAMGSKALKCRGLNVKGKISISLEDLDFSKIGSKQAIGLIQ